MLLVIAFTYVQLFFTKVHSKQIDRKLNNSIDVIKSTWIHDRLVSVTSADGDTTICVGTRLTSQWVITAANCAPMQTETLAFITIYNSSAPVYVDDQKPSTRCTITVTNIHPLYNYQTGSYDVALLRVDCAPSYEDEFVPLLLDEDNSLLKLKNGTVAYMPLVASSTDHQPVVNTLIQRNNISLAECNQTATDTTIMCAAEDGLPDDCKIHDGAPVFFYNHEGNIVLCGVVSSSVQCNSNSTVPTVFHSVASSIDWIQSVTSGVDDYKRDTTRVQYAADTSDGSTEEYYFAIVIISISPLIALMCCLILCCCKLCTDQPPAPVTAPVRPQRWLGPSSPARLAARAPARLVVGTPVRFVDGTPVWVVAEPPAMPLVKELVQLSAGDPPPPTYEMATKQPPPYMTEHSNQNVP